MSSKTDFVLFDNKTLKDIYKDIYEHSDNNRDAIQTLMNTVTPFVKTLTDATIIAPILKDLLEISVRNDEQLLKLADVVQKTIRNDGNTNNSDSPFELSADERKSLLAEAEKLKKYMDSSEKSTEKAVEKLESITKQLPQNTTDE